MRHLNLAAAVATASLMVSCAPPMTAYDYPKYGFAADFPAPPKVTDTIDPQTDRHTTVFDARSLGRDFAVTVTVTDVDPPRPYYHLDIDQLSDDASKATAKAVGGEVTYRTSAVTAEGVFGRELVISKGGRRAVRARYYLSGARFYVLTAKSSMDLSAISDAGEVDPSTESDSDNDPAVKVFLTSFRVTPPATPSARDDCRDPCKRMGYSAARR